MNIFSNQQDLANQDVMAKLHPLTEDALAFVEFERNMQLVLWGLGVVFCILLLSAFIAHKKHNRFGKIVPLILVAVLLITLLCSTVIWQVKRSSAENSLARAHEEAVRNYKPEPYKFAEPTPQIPSTKLNSQSSVDYLIGDRPKQNSILMNCTSISSGTAECTGMIESK